MDTKQKSAITGGGARNDLFSKSLHRHKEEFDCYGCGGQLHRKCSTSKAQMHKVYVRQGLDQKN